MQRRQVGNTNTFLGSNTRAKPNEDIDLNLEAKAAKVAMKPLKTPESIEIEDSVTEKNDNNEGPPEHNRKRQKTVTSNNRKGIGNDGFLS